MSIKNHEIIVCSNGRHFKKRVELFLENVFLKKKEV